MDEHDDLKAQAVMEAREGMMRKREEARRTELEELRELHAREIREVEDKHDAIITALQKVLDEPPEELVEFHEMVLSAFARAVGAGTTVSDSTPTKSKRHLAEINEIGATTITHGKSDPLSAGKRATTSMADSEPDQKRQRRDSAVEANDLSFCKQLLDKITGPRFRNIAYVFYEPVDYIGMGLTTYPKVVPKPRDLTMICLNLMDGVYDDPRAFKADLDLMIDNCVRFNGDRHTVSRMGADLAKVIEFMWDTGTTPNEVEGVECVHVDEVLKHKHDKSGQVLYLVKWLEYDDERDQTWEPASNLGDSGELQLYFDDIGGEPAPKG